LLPTDSVILDHPVFYLSQSIKNENGGMNLQKNHENTKEQLKISKIEICNDIRGDQIGLFKLVTLNCILNRITGVTFGC
jgi:hypothetical protein